MKIAVVAASGKGGRKVVAEAAARGFEVTAFVRRAVEIDGAAKVIGEGLLLSTLQTVKPTADAKLYVEYSHYRYRLIWKTANGRVDTGVDMALLETILPYVEVV